MDFPKHSDHQSQTPEKPVDEPSPEMQQQYGPAAWPGAADAIMTGCLRGIVNNRAVHARNEDLATLNPHLDKGMAFWREHMATEEAQFAKLAAFLEPILSDDVRKDLHDNT